MTVAIIPACGHSTRMGRPKLTLPIGERTIIEHVVCSLLAGGVSRVLVVIGPHLPEVGRLASSAGAEVLTLAEPTPDMRATVECGLTWMEERIHPQPHDWWLLAPADQPLLSAAVVRELLAFASGEQRCSVLVPTNGGKRGHPVLMQWRLVRGIRALPMALGVNAYLRQMTSETREVAIGDSGILADLDTPEDYQRIGGRINPAPRQAASNSVWA